MNSIIYGSAIVLCGIIAAFVVHEVFRWLQKRADLTESKLTTSYSTRLTNLLLSP
ncbi:hypothetical protein [Methanoculleus nereidis]|uniref:hypothetical protein n=1 Tax=Methanoculleus nereidis TaxID=2735141 RepID=UPI002943E255|nr:hypothetical protein [Methanoculleus sp. YWC-01]